MKYSYTNGKPRCRDTTQQLYEFSCQTNAQRVNYSLVPRNFVIYNRVEVDDSFTVEEISTIMSRQKCDLKPRVRVAVAVAVFVLFSGDVIGNRMGIADRVRSLPHTGHR